MGGGAWGVGSVWQMLSSAIPTCSVYLPEYCCERLNFLCLLGASSFGTSTTPTREIFYICSKIHSHLLGEKVDYSRVVVPTRQPVCV
jgi:hypothetical protein